MRKGGGKSKGASFEREVCRRLSLWVSNGKQEDAFWRSAMSGGRSTVAARKGKKLAAQSGDISCIHPIGQALAHAFYMECKAYRKLDFEGLLTGKGALVRFWKETKSQAASYFKRPLLIAKQNQQPIIACTDRAGLDNFDIGPSFTRIAVKQLDLYILLLDELLLLEAPKARRKYAKLETGAN